MTTELTKAAQQALEALEYLGDQSDHDVKPSCWVQAKASKARDDLRAALSQRPAAQEVGEREGWTDADADAARLALELECLLLDTKDTASVSRWWASANEALDLHRARLADPQQATPARPDFEAWWSSDGPNTASPYDAARSAWEAARQQATPEPVGEPAEWQARVNGNKHDAWRKVTPTKAEPTVSQRVEYLRSMKRADGQPAYEFRALYTRPAATHAVPEDSAQEAMTSKWCWWFGDDERFQYVYPVASGQNWQIGAGRLVGLTVHWLGCYASINLLIAKEKGADHD